MEHIGELTQGNLRVIKKRKKVVMLTRTQGYSRLQDAMKQNEWEL